MTKLKQSNEVFELINKPPIPFLKWARLAAGEPLEEVEKPEGYAEIVNNYNYIRRTHD